MDSVSPSASIFNLYPLTTNCCIDNIKPEHNSTGTLNMAEEEEHEGPVIPNLYKPPALLPIAQIKDQLLYTIEIHPVTIIVGETGSGKTTQIPQYLLNAGWCASGAQIAVTQPRRIAATS